MTVCSICGHVTSSALFAKMHQQTFHPTPSEQFADSLAAMVRRELRAAERAERGLSVEAQQRQEGTP